MVILAPVAERRDSWSVRLALDLVSAWGEVGHKVVLADGVLEYPMLHRELGVTNAEGISDAALFGASVARVARPVPGRAFFFISAGSPAGNADAVAASPRWDRLLDGFRHAGVTLVVFLRDGCAAEEALASGADDVVVLAASADDVPAGAERMIDRVRMVLGPQAMANSDEAPAGEVAPDPVRAAGTAPDPFESIPAQGSISSPVVPAALPDSPPPEHRAIGSASEAPTEEDDEALLRFDPVDTHGGHAPTDPMEAPDDTEDETAVAPEPLTAEYAPSRSGPRRGGADPHARRKLIWVGFVVLVLVVLVVLGALRSG